MRERVLLSLILIVFFCVTTACSQEKHKIRPDISGEWEQIVEKNPPVSDLQKALVAEIKDMAVTKYIEYKEPILKTKEISKIKYNNPELPDKTLIQEENIYFTDGRGEVNGEEKTKSITKWIDNKLVVEESYFNVREGKIVPFGKTFYEVSKDGNTLTITMELEPYDKNDEPFVMKFKRKK